MIIPRPTLFISLFLLVEALGGSQFLTKIRTIAGDRLAGRDGIYLDYPVWVWLDI